MNNRKQIECNWLHGLYGLNDLHCRDLLLERISIAHNGSKLTCNIKSHSGYVPKHATSQRGSSDQVSSPMSYWVSSTLQKTHPKCCHCVDCINIMSVKRRQTPSCKERLQERWSRRDKEKKVRKEKGDLVHYIRSCINTSHVIFVLYYACQE